MTVSSALLSITHLRLFIVFQTSITDLAPMEDEVCDWSRQEAQLVLENEALVLDSKRPRARQTASSLMSDYFVSSAMASAFVPLMATSFAGLGKGGHGRQADS